LEYSIVLLAAINKTVTYEGPNFFTYILDIVSWVVKGVEKCIFFSNKKIKWVHMCPHTDNGSWTHILMGYESNSL